MTKSNDQLFPSMERTKVSLFRWHGDCILQEKHKIATNLYISIAPSLGFIFFAQFQCSVLRTWIFPHPMGCRILSKHFETDHNFNEKELNFQNEHCVQCTFSDMLLTFCVTYQISERSRSIFKF